MLEYVNNILKNQPKTVLTSLIILLICAMPFLWNYAKNSGNKEQEFKEVKNIVKELPVKIDNFKTEVTDQVIKSNNNTIKYIDYRFEQERKKTNHQFEVVIDNLPKTKEIKDLLKEAVTVSIGREPVRDTIIYIPKIIKVTTNKSENDTDTNTNAFNNNHGLIFKPIFDLSMDDNLFDNKNKDNKTPIVERQNIFKRIKNIFK